MLTKALLILAGLFAGIWLRDTSGALFGLGLPVLSLLTLILAITANRPLSNDSTARIEEAFRKWLDAWSHLCTVSESDRPSVEREMASAAHMILVTANDSVVKSLQAASEQEFNTAAVSRLVLDMRRSLRHAGFMLRPSDVESLLAQTSNATSARATVPRPAASISFLR
jgi:hypothetical protein